MQYYMFNKIVESKIKPANYQILPAQLQLFSQIRSLQVQAYAMHAKLVLKKASVTKLHSTEASSLITIIGMLT